MHSKLSNGSPVTNVTSWMERDSIDGLGAKLSKAGMALHRIVFHLRALHPTVVGRAIAWAPGEPVAFLDFEHGQEELLRIQKSPDFARGIDFETGWS